MKRLVSTTAVLLLLFSGMISHAQNVGIGTASPLSKLHISTAAAADGILIDNVGGNGDPILQWSVDGQPMISMGIDDSDGDKFKIGTTAITTNTRVTIQPNGYVGIGTATPSFHLHVTGTRPSNYLAYFQNGSDQGGGVVGYSGSTYNGVGAISENENGLGLYGVHLPASGSGWAIWGTSNSSNAIGVRGTIPTNGSWLGYGGYFAGGIGYVNGLYNLSDARAKKNVSPLLGALDKVQQLRGVTYQYDTEAFGQFTGKDTRTYTGFIAQEVAQVLPEAVAEKYIVSDGTDTKGPLADMSGVERKTVTVVDYVSLVPVLVEAIKEQQQYIKLLEKRIEQLEGHH
jgi:Chaperone of endosialidase